MYDLIIIGGGPAGYTSAINYAKKGNKVLLAEASNMGGVCLNEGCIPSKAFLHFSNSFSEIENITGNKVEFSQMDILKYKNNKVKILEKGTRQQVIAAGVEIVTGWAEVKESQECFKIAINGQEYVSKFMIVATGSKPIVPEIFMEHYIKDSIDSIVLTSKEILDIEDLPENLLIIGAGVIGMEMGTHFSILGSNVTIVDKEDRIVKSFDAEIMSTYQKQLSKKGINFKLNDSVKEIKNNIALLESGDEIKFDKILVSVGRSANIDNFGLKESFKNIEIENNAIKTNNRLQTNISNLYAIGDVNGKSMLAHTAYREGEVAIDNINGVESFIDYDSIPSVIYGNIEVAEVGINEEAAIKKGFDVEVKKLSMMYSGRFVVESHSNNQEFIKVVINKENNQILGISILGKYASEIISTASIIVGEKFTKERINKIVFPHPSVSELLKDIIIK